MEVLPAIMGRALVIVAHPDDETIWMGGTILMNSKADWTVFSLSRRSDVDRFPRFRRACNQLKAKTLITDLEDDGVMTIQESISVIQKLMTKTLSQKTFSYIFTHASNGEYGHARHKGVSRAVRGMIHSRALKPKNVFEFSYTLGARGTHAVNSKHASFENCLSQKIYKEKQNVISTIYGFSKNSFEYQSSLPIETFKRVTL